MALVGEVPALVHFTFFSSYLSLDSFLSVFSQIFLYHIAPNEYTILRTGSPLMTVHVSYSTLKMKRHMKRAWERKTQNICPLKWRNSWASTQESVLKWTYMQKMSCDEVEVVCRRQKEVQWGLLCSKAGVNIAWVNSYSCLFPTSDFAALFNVVGSNHMELIKVKQK